MAGSAYRLWSDLAELTRLAAKPTSSSPPKSNLKDVVHPMAKWEPTGDPGRVVVEEGHRKVIWHYQELLPER